MKQMHKTENNPKRIAKVSKQVDARTSGTIMYSCLKHNHSKNLQIRKLCDGLSHKYSVHGERMRKSLYFYTYPSAHSQRCVRPLVKDSFLKTANSPKLSYGEELYNICDVKSITIEPIIRSKKLSDGGLNESLDDLKKCKISPNRQLPSSHSHKGMWCHVLFLNTVYFDLGT